MQSPIEVADASLTRASVATGESLVVSATVVNTGSQTETELLELRVDGRLVATKGVQIAPGENATVTFERSFSEPGTYDLTVAGTSLPALSVVAADDSGIETSTPDPLTPSGSDATATTAGNVDVVETHGLADWVREGFNASVRVTLANGRDSPVRHTVEVTVDGQRVATETVVVPANGQTTESIEFRAVSGTVRVDGTEAGSLTVGESFEEATTETTAGGGPGFGVLTVAMALLAVVLATRANRTDSDQK